MSFHWIDYVILGIITLSVITGTFRGFIKEILALLVWVLGIYSGVTYASKFQPFFLTYVHDSTMCFVLSFVCILLIALILGSILNKIVHLIIQHSGLTSTNRILGMGFGLIRGIFTVTLLIAAFNLTSIPTSNKYNNESHLYAKFNPLVYWLGSHVPKFMAHVDSALEKVESNEIVENDTFAEIEKSMHAIMDEKEIRISKIPSMNLAQAL